MDYTTRQIELARSFEKIIAASGKQAGHRD